MKLSGNNFLLSAHDLLFPKKCFGCGQEGEWLCRECLMKNQSRPGIFCPVCRHLISDNCQCRLDNFKLIGSLADYNDPFVLEIIRNIKYNGIIDLVDLFWKSRLENFWKIFGQNYCADSLLVPIPLHRQKLLWRGFNQSLIIANLLSDISGCPVADQLIMRIKNNKSQAGSNFLARQNNVKGIFRINYRELSSCWGRNIVLIDDVYTTGATMAECAKEFEKRGFKKLSAVVLAISH